MSIELHVWTQDPRQITVAELAAQAERADKMRVVAVRDHVDWDDCTIDEQGELQDGDLLVGWAAAGPADPEAAAVLRDLRAKDSWAIRQWYRKGFLGTALLHISDAPDWGNDDDEREDLLGAYGREYVSYRDAARAQYVTRTSMGRNKSDFKLQQAAAEWILHLRGGILEDPQEGAIRTWPARQKERE